MSSIQRTRSLRKPTTTTTTTPAATTGPAAAADTTRGRRTDSETRSDGSTSRLPVKPTRSASISSSSRSSMTTATTATRSTRIAGGGLTRSSSVKQTSTTTAQEPPRREASRYPPSTTVTRNRGPPRPNSAEGMPLPTKRVLTHTRAKSTATGLNGSTVLRAPTRDTVNPTAATAATRARKQSISERSTNIPGQTQPRLRPAFNTLQQHYSPAKSAAPKPLTASFLAPPSPSKNPVNVAASAETNKLQTELLQLHLLHRDAATVDEAWRASAKEKLGQRFDKLVEASVEVDERVKAEIERENVLVLRQWAAGGGLEERVQALDAVVNGLWTLGEPGGRYARVVRRFERWVDRMCELEEARKDGGRFLQDQAVLFLGELESDWKEESVGLIQRLEGWKRQLQDVGEVPEAEGEEKSSLEQMVEYCQSMIHDMLAELNIMEDIEQEALAREDEWIERMNRDDEADDTPRAGAIWRAV